MSLPIFSGDRKKSHHARTETMDLLRTYEGVEAPENFRTPEEVTRYRRYALGKSAHQARFIHRHFSEAKSVLEACCGNGRLLIALKDEFDRLAGFDLAKSRVNFARSWIEDESHRNIHVWEDDIFHVSTGMLQGQVDLVICITGAFAYFDAIEEGKGSRALESLVRFLRPGGGLIFELYQHPVNVRRCLESGDRTLRVWSELPESDPFRFSLSAFHYDEGRRVLTHAKTFVHRNGAIDEGRVEALRIFSDQEITTLLEPNFEKISIWSDWDDTSYAEGSCRLIVTARRRSDQSGQ